MQYYFNFLIVIISGRYKVRGISKKNRLNFEPKSGMALLKAEGHVSRAFQSPKEEIPC